MPAIKHKSLHCSVVEWCGRDHGGAGQFLPLTLQIAVPLWMEKYREAGPAVRAAELEELQRSDFALRMQYVLYKGPKVGDSARAFNDLARAIALLSFCPGGVTVFGTRYQWFDSTGKAV